MAAFSMRLQNTVPASIRPAWKSGKESKEQRPHAFPKPKNILALRSLFANSSLSGWSCLLALLLSSQRSVARVNSGSEPLLFRNSAAQISQLKPLFFAERSAELLLVLSSGPRDLAKDLTTSISKKQAIVASILCATPALDNAFAFEFIHKCNNPARHYPEVLGYRLLAYTRIGSDLSQQACIGGGHADF
jgi:hypothetical protein